MPLRLLLAALALVLAGPATPPPPVPADPPLWMVRDADTTIYLFGSVHWLKPNLGWFDDDVRAAFDRADTLVLETPPVDTAEAQRVQDAVGKTKDGPTLPERLPAGYRPKLAAALAELGYPAGAFDRVKPWLAATTLSVLPLKRRGYDVSAGVEAVLTGAARAAGKPIVGLEPRTQQLGYFDTLPEEAQLAMLKRQLDNMDQTGDSTDAVLAAWIAGDAAALGRIVDADQRASSAAFGKAILSDRNRRWAGWIVNRLKRPGTVFMAVGVGHLTGSDTVQRALAERGLTARRVRPAASK
ncbi:TraB/GumN family protein [Sphingomonas spermidinifaciens]|uniref:TraB/GumN family protein n=1 Tax=Sphingomonas spermidinifaciens TaxID=1141889 RepID=A0A2A4B656_9SPHN|nr:TraB/GumN family protein [Sphingomonas spermidinifaciens]PCD03126.1 TraB/GumN family protein [Sphingomonas spermidinifaciens]